MATDLPQEGEILEGRITRIETYGAFCRLDSLKSRRPPQGLIHISQLVPDQRVERVDDILAIDDIVWVKVLKVEMDPSSQRWKIQLSRKDVSQDGSAEDLGRAREAQENQRSQLANNLNSMIGMGVALDPMADRIVMKSDQHSTTTFRGGYSLVGDDEGEVSPLVEPTAPRTAPLGRGRGTTLPAWMTQQSDGPSGSKSDGNRSDRDGTDDEGKKKQHKRKHKSRDHKRRRKEKTSRKKEKRKRHRDNSDLSCAGTEESDSRSSRSEIRGSSGRKHKSSRRKRDRKLSKAADDDSSSASRQVSSKRRRERSPMGQHR